MPTTTRPSGPTPVPEARSSSHYSEDDWIWPFHCWNYDVPSSQPKTFAIIEGELRRLPLFVEAPIRLRTRKNYFAMVSSQETGIYDGSFESFRRYIAGYPDGLVANFETKTKAKAWLETMLPSISVYKEIVLPRLLRKKRYYVITGGCQRGITREGSFGGFSNA